jgi:ribosomal protein S18 acetylase RimI-like enzyme
MQCLFLYSLNMVQFRKTELKDLHNISLLYRKVTSEGETLALSSSDITVDYITEIFEKTTRNGLNLMVEDNGLIIGEVHAYSSGLKFQSHVLTDFTIAVHPLVHGSGVGRKLMNKFFTTLQSEMTHILRVELIIRESNQKAIRFYESSGFVKEGELKERLRNAFGHFENEILMAWMNPSFLVNSQK